MSEKQNLSADELNRVIHGVQNDLFQQVYLPVFQKTASDLGVPINTQEDLEQLVQIANALRPSEPQAPTSPYAKLASELTGGEKTASTQINTAGCIQAYVSELVKDAGFIKLARTSALVTEQVKKLN